MDRALPGLVARGEFEHARALVRSEPTNNPEDRNFFLDRLRLLVLSLATGELQAAEYYASLVYDTLRTQGLNRDRTAASFFFGEGNVRIWKGEPFEQAMGYHYVAVLDGLHGDWGNVRAAANNSLFLLRDFSRALQNQLAGDLPNDPLAQREALLRAASERSGADGLGVPYDREISDFELGYVMKAIAARQMGREQEMAETLATLRRIAPHLDHFARRIERGGYNTVLVVDYGLAPQKYGAGPGDAIAMFRPRTPSTSAPLEVDVGGRSDSFPVITDLNRLTRDLRWANLEDLRRAKADLGQALTVGGAGVAALSDDRDVRIGGLVAAAAGLWLQGTAGVDTRHAEVLPQRTYIALLTLPDAPTAVELRVAGRPRTRTALAMQAPADPDDLALHYVRLADPDGAWDGQRFHRDFGRAWPLGRRDRAPGNDRLAEVSQGAMQ